MSLYYKLFYFNSDTRNEAGGYPQKFRAVLIEYSSVFQNMLMHPKTVLEVLEIVKTIQNVNKKKWFFDFWKFAQNLVFEAYFHWWINAKRDPFRC